MAAQSLGEALLLRGARIHIPVSEPPREQPHLIGRGGMQHRPIAMSSSTAASVYSTHECVGEMSDVKPRAQRVCLFTRVCLNPVEPFF